MNISDDEFLMNKRDFAKNSIGYGLAIKYLSSLTGRSIEDCATLIFEQASSQMYRLDQNHIDDLIRQYYTGKQNKAKSIFMEA